MSSQIPKSERIQELLKCGKDPIYFIKTYVKVQHATKGTLPFNTYDYQNDCIKDFVKNRFNIVVKSRQLGLSTVTAAYALWMALFHKDKNILVIATKLPTAVNFIKKVKFMINSLPPWLLLSQYRDTQQSVIFNNGSEIKAIPTSEDAGRSEALSLLIVDEAAHVRYFDEIWAGLYPTLSTGGSAILISTPKGVGGTYHKIYSDAIAGVNNFNVIKLPWYVHPERDEEWFKEDSKQFAGDTKRIAQEYLCVGEDSRIITSCGFKLAKDIVQGDLVLTGKGRYRKVLQTHIRNLREEENLYSASIPGAGKNEFLITGDHPVLSHDDEYNFSKVDDLFSKVKNGDRINCCLFPKFQCKNDSIDKDRRIDFLLGKSLGAALSRSGDKIDKNSDFINRFISSNKDGYNFIKMENLNEMSQSFMRGVIVGYAESSNPKILDGKMTFDVASERLLYQFKTLLSSFGCYPFMGKKINPDHIGVSQFTIEIDIREDMGTIQPLLDGSGHEYQHENLIRSSKDGYFIGTPIFRIVSDRSLKERIRVVDIKVEEDSTFIVESLVVHNCDFISSGDTFLQNEQMEWLKLLVREPIEKHGEGKRIWVWEHPQPGRKYIITADIARGDALDNSAFHIIDASAIKVVAEFKGKIPPDKFGELLVEYGYRYNNALLCPENNTYGFMTCSKIKDLRYPKVYYKNARYAETYVPKEGDKPGFDTQATTKIQALTRLEEFIRNKVLISHSQRLIDELSTFVWNGTKASSLKGYNDDLVMSIAIGAWLVDTLYGTSERNTSNDMPPSIIVSRRSYEEVIQVDSKKPVIGITNTGGTPNNNVKKATQANVDFNWLLK